MAEERVTTGSAVPAQRQPRWRAGRTVAPAEEGIRPDLDERERNINPRRKGMGPATPPQDGRDVPDVERLTLPEVPPTDPHG
jgi:hypothetical protein